MADEPAERASAINTVGASAVVGTLGAVVVWWAVAGRHPGGVVVGVLILVVAAAGVGAGVGVPRDRVRRGALVGGGGALVVAVVVIGALVVQARSVGVGGDRRLVLDQRVEAAWVAGDEIVGVTFDRVVTIDPEDGATQNGSGIAVGDHIVVRSGVAGSATTDVEHLTVRDRDGATLWDATVTVGDEAADRVSVVAVTEDGAAAVHGCIEARCELVGLDAAGRERWRQAVDDARFGEGPVLVDRGYPEDPVREVPHRLVLVDGLDGPDAEEVDLATGERTTLAVAGAIGVVDDTVTIARSTSDGCEVGIVRGDAAEDVVPVPCPEGDLGRAHPVGGVVVHPRPDDVVALDLARGEAGVAPIVPGTRLGLAGEGVVVDTEDGAVRLRRIVDDTEIARFDPAWGFVASGPDGVVLERERESGNPFAPEERREVAVVDPATGEICARVRLDVPFISRASPLPGCRAVLSPPDGPDVLVG